MHESLASRIILASLLLLVCAGGVDVVGSSSIWPSSLGTPVDFFNRTFEQRTKYESTKRATHTSDNDIVTHLRFGLFELGMVLDTTGSVFDGAPLSDTRLGMSDLRLVQRVMAADGEYWSAVYPLTRVPNETPIDGRFTRRLVEQGFTLVLNRMNYRYAPIADLCTRLTNEYFGFRIQANLYLTPGVGTHQGFEAHFDFMDNMVVQLVGSKLWSLYDPPLIRLPRSDQKFKPRQAAIEQTTRREMRIEKGEIIYIPRGVIHEARTQPKEETHGADADSPPVSMHLTFGIEIDPAFTYHGLLHLFLDRIAREASDSLKTRLSMRIPPCTCRSSSSSSSSSPSPPMHQPAVSYLDLLQWVIFDAASQGGKHSTDTDNLNRTPGRDRFRRSLWGLHWFDGATVKPYSGVVEPRPPVPVSRLRRSIAEELLTPTPNDEDEEWRSLPIDTRRSLAMLYHTADHVLHLIDVVTNASRVLSDVMPSLVLFQTRLRPADDAAVASSISDAHHPSSPSLLTSRRNPTQTQYEYETLFQDEIIQPYIEPIIRETAFGAYIDIAQQSPTHKQCVRAYFDDLQRIVDPLWFDLLASLDLSAWRLFLAPLVPAGVAASPPPSLPVSFDPLVASLARISAHLLATRATHFEAQAAYVRENARRQEQYLNGRMTTRHTQREEKKSQQPTRTMQKQPLNKDEL